MSLRVVGPLCCLIVMLLVVVASRPAFAHTGHHHDHAMAAAAMPASSGAAAQVRDGESGPTECPGGCAICLAGNCIGGSCGAASGIAAEPGSFLPVDQRDGRFPPMTSRAGAAWRPALEPEPPRSLA